MKSALHLIIAFLLFACTGSPLKHDPETLKLEIAETEMAFEKMAADSGIAAAFKTFAAPGAVLKRGNRLIVGYDSVVAYMNKSFRVGESLTWTPDFIDVSASGDLAYTYGKYVFTYTDSANNRQKQHGIFHTLWKRQPDGSWKFVWD